MYKNIVVPINPKKLSKTALLHTFKLASYSCARIDFVHASTKIFTDDEELMLRVSVEKFHKEEERIIEETQQTVATFLQCDELRDLSCSVPWEVSIIPSHEDAAKAIVTFAEEKKADLFVLSIPRHSSKWKMLLGNVREWVIHHAECPVLVIHA